MISDDKMQLLSSLTVQSISITNFIEIGSAA